MTAKKSTHLPLAEYQRLTGLSDRALVFLLSGNHLSCVIDEDQGILVDYESVTNRQLLTAITHVQREGLSDVERLISEKFAQLITQKIDEISSDALALFLQRAESADKTASE